MQIAALFEETAANEKEHAKIWFKYLHGGAVPGTIENLARLRPPAKLLPSPGGELLSASLVANCLIINKMLIILGSFCAEDYL